MYIETSSNALLINSNNFSRETLMYCPGENLTQFHFYILHSGFCSIFQWLIDYIITRLMYLRHFSLDDSHDN